VFSVLGEIFRISLAVSPGPSTFPCNVFPRPRTIPMSRGHRVVGDEPKVHEPRPTPTLGWVLMSAGASRGEVAPALQNSAVWRFY
jgi:hypothetical protein